MRTFRLLTLYGDECTVDFLQLVTLPRNYLDVNLLLRAFVSGFGLIEWGGRTSRPAGGAHGVTNGQATKRGWA